MIAKDLQMPDTDEEAAIEGADSSSDESELLSEGDEEPGSQVPDSSSGSSAQAEGYSASDQASESEEGESGIS